MKFLDTMKKQTVTMKALLDQYDIDNKAKAKENENLMQKVNRLLEINQKLIKVQEEQKLAALEADEAQKAAENEPAKIVMEVSLKNIRVYLLGFQFRTQLFVMIFEDLFLKMISFNFLYLMIQGISRGGSRIP